MKFISWNVNGLRAILKKDFVHEFESMAADFFCIQETKLQADQVDLNLPGYHLYFNYAERKGYSGVAIFSKFEPISITKGIGVEDLDHEGRALTLEFANFYLVTCYTPNSQPNLKRIDFRTQWDQAFRQYVDELNQSKPVIICGDFNVAHADIDLKYPDQNQGNAGFSEPERDDFTALLNSGYLDTFRTLHPNDVAYTWWDYRTRRRDPDNGWRIDYFLCSKQLRSQITQAAILPEMAGSDHCPILLDVSGLNV